LGKLGESAAPAVPSLIQLLDDRTEVVRREAISSLGKIGPPARDALEKLRQIAEHDKDAAVRRLAQSAIRKIAH